MSEPIRRLGVLANLTRPRAREALEAFAEAAAAQGISLAAPPELAAAFPAQRKPETLARGFSPDSVQAVASLGGDGSLLAAAHALADARLPLVGFNIGHLGYLTAVNEDGFADALRQLSLGDYALESRTALAPLLCRAGARTALPDALNDVVVSRTGGRACALCLEIDGEPAARWTCDGIILSTPTGSTAYALSVGGPVVLPGVSAIAISAIAPHALTARPLVVPDSAALALRLAEGETQPAAIHVDGQDAQTLAPGETLRVRRSGREISLLVPSGHTPYAALARKLGWGAGFTR